MSPCDPRALTFSETITGRPRMLMGGPATPLFSQTGPPPVPTESAMVASWGKVSGETTHTAVARDWGSMREYILTMFSHTMVAVGWPVSAAWTTRELALR